MSRKAKARQEQSEQQNHTDQKPQDCTDPKHQAHQPCIAILSVTANGGELAKQIEGSLQPEYRVQRYTLSKYPVPGAIPYTDGKLLTKQLFSRVDGLVFVSACGIAVRLIAPFITSKVRDPAVVVVDQAGKYAISLLSGHLGGANALTDRIAAGIRALPVITTATDGVEAFSPDLFAQKNGLWISDLKMAKELAAAVVNGEQIGFYSQYPYEKLPENLAGSMVVTSGENRADSPCEKGICVTERPEKSPFCRTLYLLPRNLVLGVGCKKGTDPEALEQFLLQSLEHLELPLQRVGQIASIDLKKEEQAICDFAEKYKIPFVTYTAEELARVEGNFSHSDFVEQTTGVDNVCERSAVCGGGRLCYPKHAMQGMTMALGELPVELYF